MNQPDMNPDHRRIFEQWHLAAKTRDQAALIALYADDATVETPLATQIMDHKKEGVLRGKVEIKKFLDSGARKRPNEWVRWYRTGQCFSSGNTLIWEYPRETPEGEQIDVLEVMEIENGLIKHQRIYWGWRGLQHLMTNAATKTWQRSAG